jgi:hypothetical protein
MITETLTSCEACSAGNHAWTHILLCSKDLQSGQGARRDAFPSFVEPRLQLLGYSVSLAGFQLQQLGERQLVRLPLEAHRQQRLRHWAQSLSVSLAGESKGVLV